MLGTAPCGTEAENLLLTQKFGIEYVIKRDGAGPDMKAIAESGKLQRSGNPGYQLNHPLLVGQGLLSGEAKDVNVFGFFARASDNKGGCIAKLVPDGSPSDASAQRLEYGNKLTVSCDIAATTEADFKNICASTTARTDLEIFAQFLDRFKYLGIFGNAQPGYGGDWVETVFSATEDLTEAGDYDVAKKTCKNFAASLEVEILTSQVGFKDQLQDYIVGARVKAVKHDWIFNPDPSLVAPHPAVNAPAGSTPSTPTPQTFSYYASVSYR